MQEVELKLQVPPDAIRAVEQAVAAGTSQRTRLQALYVDTADRRLAAAGIALRLRKEGRRWVQTLKTGSAHGIARGEHNVPVTVAAGLQPALDITRHAGTPPGAALAAALGLRDLSEPAAPLLTLYSTDIWRRHRVLRTRHGSVELAFDRGEIRSDVADGRLLRWPVCELEIELHSGAPRAVVEVARRLAVQHGLWLDTRSKAERGDRLSRGLAPGDAVPAVKAPDTRLDKHMQPAEAWQQFLDDVLAQALPNWSELAGGSTAPEAVHQLRVALRRLRSAQRFVEDWPGVPAPTWDDAARALFEALGQTRDRDVLGAGLQPSVDAALADIGEPPLTVPVDAGGAGWSARTSATHGLLFIDLLAATLAPRAAPVPAQPVEAAEPADAPSLKARIAERLQHWHRQAARDAKRFDAIDDEARHRLRKRLKRLRYAIEFSESLFTGRKTARYLARLRVAQERLGEFNDVAVALAAYRALAQTEPRAWFAVGWLAAQRSATLVAAARELQRLHKAAPFWR